MSVIRAVCEPLLIVYEHCIFPDARRVAPIRVCVLCLCLVVAFSACVLCLRLVVAGPLPYYKSFTYRVSYILH